MDWVTTTTLLEDLKTFRSADAWERFVSRFRGPVTRFAREMGVSEADADDVAQEALIAFATAYRDGRYDRDRGRLSSWLFGIVWRHVLRQRRRTAKPDRQGGDARIDDFPADAAAQDLWDRHWTAFVLRECLLRVKSEFQPATFRAYHAVVHQELSAAEAAEVLGVSIKAVYNAKHRVLTRLRILRAEIEGEPDAAR